MTDTYKNKPPEWREGLFKHLEKSEIEYVAKHGGGDISFLQPFVGDPEAMKAYIISLGFKVRRHEPVNENGVEWVVTTNGINIFLTDGFCCRSVK